MWYNYYLVVGFFKWFVNNILIGLILCLWISKLQNSIFKMFTVIEAEKKERER